MRYPKRDQSNYSVIPFLGSPAAKVNLLPGTTFISMECFDKEGNSSEVFYIARDGDEIGLWQKAMNNADVLIFELVQQ